MKIINGMEKILYYFVGISFVVLFSINILQIFLRTFTSISFLWVVDFSQLVFVWIMMMGAAIAFRRKEHLLVGYLKEKLPKRMELSIDLLTRVLLLIFYIVLIVKGIDIAKIRMNMAYVSLGWPTGIAYLALPVSGVFMVLFALESIWDHGKKLIQGSSHTAANGNHSKEY